MTERTISGLLALLLTLLSSACGASGKPDPITAPADDMAIVVRASTRIQLMREELPVALRATRNGSSINYTVSGNVDMGQAIVLVAWYDISGRLVGVSRGRDGSAAVEDGASLYQVFLLDSSTFEPLCRAWSSSAVPQSIGIPQTGWTEAVPADYICESRVG